MIVVFSVKQISFILGLLSQTSAIHGRRRPFLTPPLPLQTTAQTQRAERYYLPYFFSSFSTADVTVLDQNLLLICLSLITLKVRTNHKN